MNQAIKTFACVGAYAAGLVVGMTATTIVVTSVEGKLAKRRLAKAQAVVDQAKDAVGRANDVIADTVISTAMAAAVAGGTARGGKRRAAA